MAHTVDMAEHEGQRGGGGEALLDALAGLAATLAGCDDIVDALHDLTARLADLLGVTGVGVSLVEDGRLAFVTSDSDALGRLEEVQEREQRGPCVEAVRNGHAVAVADLAHTSYRWPAYIQQAAASGIRAVASVPMRTTATTVGSVELYDAQAHEWTATELRIAGVMADLATSYLVNATRLSRQQRMAEHLQRALDTRVVIEQAKGIVAAHRGVGVDTAFGILRRHANDHHATLHATAEAVVKLGLRP